MSCNRDIYKELDYCLSKIEELEKKLNNISKPLPNKSWYKSIGIWLSIILIVLMLIVIYIFYLTNIGYGIILPAWMK